MRYQHKKHLLMPFFLSLFGAPRKRSPLTCPVREWCAGHLDSDS